MNNAVRSREQRMNNKKKDMQRKNALLTLQKSILKCRADLEMLRNENIQFERDKKFLENVFRNQNRILEFMNRNNTQSIKIKTVSLFNAFSQSTCNIFESVNKIEAETELMDSKNIDPNIMGATVNLDDLFWDNILDIQSSENLFSDDLFWDNLLDIPSENLFSEEN